MIESPDTSTLVVDPFPKPGGDDPENRKLVETRPFYESVLPQLVGMLVHQMIQGELTGSEQTADPLSSFIAYCDTIPLTDGKKLGSDILLPRAQAIAQEVAQKLRGLTGNNRNTVWLAEVSFTQSREATEQLRSLVSDPDIVAHVTSSKFLTVDAYAKHVIQDLSPVDGRVSTPPERFPYNRDILSYTPEQKVALFDALLRLYGHYDYGDISTPEVSLTVNARADLVRFACAHDDTKAQEVIGVLNEVARHHLHSMPLKNVLHASSLIDTHFKKLKEAARLIIEGRITCTFVEIKTKARSDDMSPKSLVQVDPPPASEKNQDDTVKMQDVSHTVLAAIQVLAQLLSLSEDVTNQTPSVIDRDVLTALSQLLTQPYGEKFDLLRRVWPKLQGILSRQQFIMVDVGWPVTLPSNPSVTHNGRQQYAWNVQVLQGAEPAVEVQDIPHGAVARWVMKHGKYLINRWLQANTRSQREQNITVEPMGEDIHEPPY